MSKKDIVDLQPGDQEGGPRVFELRGYLVMLATKVAEIFNVHGRPQNLIRGCTAGITALVVAIACIVLFKVQ